MTRKENDLQYEKFYLALRPLRDRASRAPHDLKLGGDIARIIAEIKPMCKGDVEAMAGLEVAKILLSLGNKQDALRKIRATLIDAKGFD